MEDEAARDNKSSYPSTHDKNNMPDLTVCNLVYAGPAQMGGMVNREQMNNGQRSALPLGMQGINQPQPAANHHSAVVCPQCGYLQCVSKFCPECGARIEVENC